MPTIRDLRLRRDWPQSYLAFLSGVGTQTIWRAEAGRPIRKVNALAICKALEVALDQVEGIELYSAVQTQNRRRA